MAEVCNTKTDPSFLNLNYSFKKKKKNYNTIVSHVADTKT